jgi:hypothetical protein
MNANKTNNELLATLTKAQAVQVSMWAKDWLPELTAMAKETPAKYDAALRGVIQQVKAGRKPQRRKTA